MNKKYCSYYVPNVFYRASESRVALTLKYAFPHLIQNILLRRFVTMDETWIHHHSSGSREESKQLVKPGENTPKRPKMQQLTGKIVVSVVTFFTGAYDGALLDRLVVQIRNHI